MHFSAVLAAGVLSLALTGLAQAATLQNGSFEQPGTFSGNWQQISAGQTILSDWTVGGSVDLINTGWTASDQSYSIDMSGGGAGTLSQTITDMVIGQSYTITFDMAGNSAGGSAVKALGVVVENMASQTFLFDTTGQSFSDPQWESRSLTFEATDTAALLTFTSQENSAYGAALDNVEISNVSAVPLPAGVVLLATGLGALALRRRARS